MAAGPLPKEQRSRERDNHKYEEYFESGEVAGPDLPEGMLPNDEDWHPMTRQWWDSVRRYPLLAKEPDIGWQFLLDTALMHHVMWSKGKWEFAAELRLRAAKIATTPEDRIRLKIRVTPIRPKTEDEPKSKKDSASVTSLNARRDRLADK